jgi:uncharacterized membrane protein
MDHKPTSLPSGAGAVTGTAAAEPNANALLANRQASGADARQPYASAGESDGEFGQRRAHREIVPADTGSSPTTATIVGAAIAGAVAGAAIPFLLAGRASRQSTASDRRDTNVAESIVINRPAREIYDFWRNFTNLSRFMDNIKSVETLGDTRSHWVIKAPAGTSVEFDSRVVDDVPGRSISWESEPGAAVPNRGRVEFIETASGNGTNVMVTMNYDPPAGAAGRIAAKLFGREPSVQAREDLARLKVLLESPGGS